MAYQSEPPCTLHLRVVRLYCAQPDGLTEVRLDTFLVNFVWPHIEVIITEKIPDKTLPEGISRKSLPL